MQYPFSSWISYGKWIFQSFRCKQCGLHLETKWVRTKPGEKKPMIDYSTHPGPGKVGEEFCTVWCYFCKEKFYKCDDCKEHMGAEDFSPSMWHHRFQRGATCQRCEAARKHTCDLCRYEVGEPKQRCSQCGISKPSTEYSPGMWHHKAEVDRSIICLQCAAEKAILNEVRYLTRNKSSRRIRRICHT